MSMTKAQRARARENAQRIEDHRTQLQMLNITCPVCNEASLSPVDSRDEDGLIQRNFPVCGHKYPEQGIKEMIHAEGETFRTGVQWVSPAIEFINGLQRRMDEGVINAYYGDTKIVTVAGGQWGMMQLTFEDQTVMETHIANPKLSMRSVELDVTPELEALDELTKEEQLDAIADGIAEAAGS